MVWQIFTWFVVVGASLGLGWAGWTVAHGHYYTSGDEIGYNMGLIGGLMMLTLLAYPVRKRLRSSQRWGAIRYWFSLHMMLGIFGPLLVLFHSTFHIKSINAAVASVCMVVVATSGMIGRFAYRHIHRGLYGSKISTKELQAELFGSEKEAQSRLKDFPKVLLTLHDFHQYATSSELGLVARAWRFLTLPLRRQVAGRRSLRELADGRSPDFQALRKLIREYLYGVERLARFDVFERIFSLWHVLHIPLVYLLVVTAIWHVFAVHMY